MTAAASGPPFSPTLRIYPGGNPVDASTWGAGVDISSYVRHPGSDGGQAITYGRGRPDEAATVDAGQMSLTLDNRTGVFSTRNPLGPWYGDLRRGTPIRLATIAGEDLFNRVASGGLGTSSGGGAWTSSSNWSAASTYGQWNATGAGLNSQAVLAGAGTHDAEVRMTVWPTVVATGAELIYGVALRRVDGSNSVFLSLQFDPGGTMTVMIRNLVAASFTTLASAAFPGTYVANDKYRIVAQADGSALRLKVWKPASPATPDVDEPDAWTLSTTSTVASGTGMAMYFWRRTGNTNAGTVAFQVSDFRAEAPEFTGSVASWPVRWNKRGTNCWAPITAAGVLRRIKQSAKQLKSPLFRQLSSYAPTAYWPLEDQTDSSTFGSAVPYVGSARGYSVNAAGDSTLAGASVSPVLTAANGTIRATTSRRQSGTGFAVMWLMKLTALPTTNTKIATITAAGRITSWEIWLETSGTLLRILGYESDGTLSTDTLTGYVGISSPTSWVAFQLEAEFDGVDTVNWAMIWHEVGDELTWAVTGGMISTVTPRAYGTTLGGSDLNGAAFSHLWIGENTLPFVSTTFNLVSDGYRTETASARVARLCAEEGIPIQVEAGESAQLGPQRIGDFLTQLQDAADADYGILYESGSGLAYRPRGARYERDVNLALSVAAGEIDDPPEPIEDDQRVRNDWTVSRTDGSSARVYDQDHITAEGNYSDSATLNVLLDADLPDQAGWRVYLGTRPDLRWPALTVNFARNPDLIESWRAAPHGFRLTVDTGLDQVTANDPDVIVEGWEATLEPSRWTVSMNCSPAKPWDVTTLNDSLTQVDVETSALDADIDDNDVSIVVTYGTDRFSAWLTTGTPWDIQIGGEVMTVTAVSALFSTTKQTLTVTRSVNGVAKSHAAGALVRLAYPIYLAL